MTLVPIHASAQYRSVGATALDFDPVASDVLYQLTASVPTFVRQSLADDPAPDATPSDGSVYLPRDAVLALDGAFGPNVSIVRAGDDDGFAVLVRMTMHPQPRVK